MLCPLLERSTRSSRLHRVTFRPQNLPAPLLVAASLAAVEGLLLVAFAVVEAASISANRLAVGITTTVFLAAYGGLVLLCAWAVARGHSWGRSPLVLTQLIQLGVAWSFWGGDTKVVAGALAV